VLGGVGAALRPLAATVRIQVDELAPIPVQLLAGDRAPRTIPRQLRTVA
jgi:hypothetical protein